MREIQSTCSVFDFCFSAHSKVKSSRPNRFASERFDTVRHQITNGGTITPIPFRCPTVRAQAARPLIQHFMRRGLTSKLWELTKICDTDSACRQFPRNLHIPRNLHTILQEFGSGPGPAGCKSRPGRAPGAARFRRRRCAAARGPPAATPRPEDPAARPAGTRVCAPAGASQ